MASVTTDSSALVTTLPRPRHSDELIEHTRRASRIAAVRAEKALHLAGAYERRARRGVGNTVLYLTEARRLRADAMEQIMVVRRHTEALETLSRPWETVPE